MRQSISLYLTIYALKFNFNLIFLNQLKKTGISYHDEKNYIILKKKNDSKGFNRNFFFIKHNY